MFLALAPVARLDHSQSDFLKTMTDNMDDLFDLAFSVGMYDFFSPVPEEYAIPVAEFCM